MNHPDFRVTGKIFASLGVPNKSWGMVKLTPEQQRALSRRRRRFSSRVAALGVGEATRMFILPPRKRAWFAGRSTPRQRTSPHARRRKLGSARVSRIRALVRHLLFGLPSSFGICLPRQSEAKAGGSDSSYSFFHPRNPCKSVVKKNLQRKVLTRSSAPW